jgi:Na+-transporting NADH:ubiquinone oxidoreductase subunit C
MANPIRAFLDLPNDSTTKTLGVAVGVALASALVVSTASVLLKPIQDANIAAEQAARMEAMLDQLPGMRDLMMETGVTSLETRMVDLGAGAFAPDANPTGYDMLAAGQDPATSVELTPEQDLASIKRRPNLAPVYLLEKDGTLMLIVLPVYGQGYASTIRAMLALEADLQTVAALTVLEQGETPGLGALIAEDAWQAQWPGTTAIGEDGTPVIEVVKDGATEPWEIDGLTGATRTSNAMQFMVNFWLGPDGYGPVLERLRTEGL